MRARGVLLLMGGAAVTVVILAFAPLGSASAPFRFVMPVSSPVLNTSPCWVGSFTDDFSGARAVSLSWTSHPVSLAYIFVTESTGGAFYSSNISEKASSAAYASTGTSGGGSFPVHSALYDFVFSACQWNATETVTIWGESIHPAPLI